jgi:Tfp pilus assembly protein PilN
MRAVNLLPGDSGTQKALDRALAVGIACTVLVAALLAGGFFLEKGNAASQRQRLAVVQQELADVQAQQLSAHSPTPVMLQVPGVLTQQELWQGVLDTALSTRVAWDVLLRQLEYVVPDKVTLTNVTVGGSGASAGSTIGAVTIGGTAFSSDDIAVFTSTLVRVHGLSQVNLVSDTAPAGSKVQTFQISAQMSLPAALTTPPATDTTSTTGG